MTIACVVLGIPTLSRFDLLQACVESARWGTVAPDRILIIDNSGGACPSIPGATISISRSNLGVAASWNALADAAYGMGADHLVISNDDVTFAPDTIARLLLVAEAHPLAGVVGAIGGHLYTLFYLRRQAWEQVGRFDEQFWPAYFEDNDYARRLTLAGWQECHAPSAVWHVGSASLPRSDAFAMELHHQNFRANRGRYIAKWGGPPGEETYTTPYGG